MEKISQSLSKRLIYSGAITTILPFTYAICLLVIQAIDAQFVIDFYKLSPEIFYSMSFFILFIAALVSSCFLYAFPRGKFSFVGIFVASLISSLALKTYYFSSIISLFYCEITMALSLASLIFFSMILIASFYSSDLETRLVLMLSSLCFSLSFTFFNFKESILCIFMARAFVGLAAGVISKYLTCYLSIISPINYRGIFSSLYTFGVVGGLFSFNAFLSFYKNFFSKTNWSLPLFFFLFPALLCLCIPLNLKNSHENTLYSLLVNPKARKSLFFVAAFHISQNLCGINQIGLNPESIFGKNYGFHSAAILFVGLVVNSFVGYLMDIYGRKPLTLISCAFLLIGCVAFYFKFYVLFFTYFFSFGFNSGLSVIPYVILGEIFPIDFISPGAFFGTSCNWVGSALSTIIPQGDLLNAYNPAFIVYFVSTLLFALSVLLFFRETKRQTPAFQ